MLCCLGKRRKPKDYVTAYHYTDHQSAIAIENTGEIRPSSSGAYGAGVYLTTMPPSEGRKAVSQNNWDGGWETVESQGRADYVFEVDIPADRVRDPGSGSRDILVHDGPINLNSHKWKAMHK